MQVSSVEWKFVQDLVQPIAWVDAKAFHCETPNNPWYLVFDWQPHKGLCMTIF